jgi:hypothetical protein
MALALGSGTVSLVSPENVVRRLVRGSTIALLIHRMIWPGIWGRSLVAATYVMSIVYLYQKDEAAFSAF